MRLPDAALAELCEHRRKVLKNHRGLEIGEVRPALKRLDVVRAPSIR